MSRNKFENHPYREWLIHLAGGDVNKAIEFLKTGNVPLKNVIDMFRFFSGSLDIMKSIKEAANESLNQVEHALPFINNKSKAGKKSKRRKEDTFLVFKKLVGSGTINIRESYEWNKKKIKDSELKISQRTYYNYRDEMK